MCLSRGELLEFIVDITLAIPAYHHIEVVRQVSCCLTFCWKDFTAESGFISHVR